MGWVGHVSRLRRMHDKTTVGNPDGKRSLGHIGVNGIIIILSRVK
jgi:hypothetical protein